MRAVAASASKAAVAAVAALLLAACTAPADGDGARRPAAKPELTISGAKPDTAGRSASLPPEGAVDADPKRLIGLDHAGVTAMLGEPEFRRKDAPAELWRYRGEHCMLDLFLYGPDKAAAADKRVLVRHVEARALSDGRVTTTECLRALLRARATRDAG